MAAGAPAGADRSTLTKTGCVRSAKGFPDGDAAQARGQHRLHEAGQAQWASVNAGLQAVGPTPRSFSACWAHLSVCSWVASWKVVSTMSYLKVEGRKQLGGGLTTQHAVAMVAGPGLQTAQLFLRGIPLRPGLPTCQPPVAALTWQSPCHPAAR